MKKKLLLSFIDQGIVSISNFLLITILARLFTQADFGFVSFLLFIGVLINNIQISLITQPHNVIAANLNDTEYLKYTNGAFGLNLTLNFFLTIISGVIFTLQYVGIVNLHDNLTFILFTVFYLNIKLLQDFLRRVLFTSGQISQIVISDIVAYGGSSLILLLALYFKIKSLSFIIILLCFPFIVSIIYFFISSNITYNYNINNMQFAFIKSFDFARWSFAATLTSWIGTRIFPITLGLIVNMESVAIYAILMNIINTLNPIFYTLTNFLTTVFAKISEKYNLFKQILNTLFALLPIITIASLILILYPNEILSLLYGSQYIEYAKLLQYISVSIILIAISNVLQLYLRATKNVKSIFKSFFYTSLFSLTFGIYLIYTYRVQGAVIAFIVSWVISNILLSLYTYKSYREKHE